MKNNINNKSVPNQIRVFMKRMRNGNNPVVESQETKKNLSVRDMLKITRKLNEAEEKAENRVTKYDPQIEEQKFLNYFDDLNVDVKFEELIVRDDLIFWGGTIDGVVQFVYTVTPYEKTTQVKIKYLPDFTADNPDNDAIVEKIESYFDIFYKYWRNNILQT